MSDEAVNDPLYQTLPDPWERTGPIVLNGLLERQKFGPLLIAFFALILGFISYQVVGGIATFAFLLMNGVTLEHLAQDLPTVLGEQAAALISANALGLLFGLGAVGFLLPRLHTSRPLAFLRLRKADSILLALAVVGIIVLQPMVQWIGSLNQSIPLPEFLRAWEEPQNALLEHILSGEFNVFFSLIMMAMAPALCEEVFFRGYLQRHLERGCGIVWGIILTGVVFGAFHLRFSQLLPLVLLGIYMAYLSWRTGSLWVPILVHFVNNAFAVIIAEFIKDQPDFDMADAEQINIPWYLVGAGLLFFFIVVYVIQQRSEHLLAQQPAIPLTNTLVEERTDEERPDA